MIFKKNNYTIVKSAISEELAQFCYNYFILKREVATTMFKDGFISPYTSYFGIWNDQQVPDTYSHYGDIVMETLLLKILKDVEKITKLKLSPNYSYARIYKKGDILKRHKDRFSCEISTTMNLGGDPWPIYLSSDENVGIPNNKDITFESKSKGTAVNLKPGDMLVYRGNLLEHWREPFEGNNCAQVFFHYNNIKSKGSKENLFDRRPHLGLPPEFRK